MFYDLYEICRKDKQRSRSVVTKGQWEVGMKSDCLIGGSFGSGENLPELDRVSYTALCIY